MKRSLLKSFFLVFALTLALISSPVDASPRRSPGATAERGGSVSFPGLGTKRKYDVAKYERCISEYDLQARVTYSPNPGEDVRNSQFYFIGSILALDPLDRKIGETRYDIAELGLISLWEAKICQEGIHTLRIAGKIIKVTETGGETVAYVDSKAKFYVYITQYLYQPKIRTASEGKKISASISVSCGKTMIQQQVGTKWVIRKTFKGDGECSSRVIEYRVRSAGHWRVFAPATKFSRPATGKAVRVD